MEIRNALKKIDNYLSVVANLNRTILEEGTMAPDELKLMKKYLRGCIERIEEIEQKLNIAEPATENEVAVEQSIPLFQNISATEALMEEEILPEMNPASIVEEEVLLQSDQIIIDPESIRDEVVTATEIPAIELPEVEEVIEPVQELVAPPVILPEVIETVVMETVVEKNTFQLIGEEIEEEEQIIGNEEKRTWADLWEDKSEPINNGLVNEEEVIKSEVSEVPVNIVSEEQIPLLETPEIKNPLVASWEDEPEIEKIIEVKEETTVNDFIQTKNEPGLFEMFTPASTETVQVKNYGSETQFHDAAETDVMVAELENKQPEFNLSSIFNQVRTGSEERIKAAKTLSESIALNDKFIFVRELFGNQFNEYESSLRTLDSMHSYSEAEQYCQQNLHGKFKWNDRPANADKFFALLEKRFTA